MDWFRNRLFPQPMVGAITLTVGLSALTTAWGQALLAGVRTVDLRVLLLAIALTMGYSAAQLFPIHVRQNGKVHMGSVALFLIVVLLPPYLAGASALIALASAELWWRPQRGGYYSDLASQVGRMLFVAVAGSVFFHVAAAGGIQPLRLACTAIVLYAGDMLTFPAVVSPITGEKPWVVIASSVRETFMLESGQFLVAVLGAVAAQEQIWTLGLLAVPTAMIFATGRRNKELQDNTRFLLERMADTVDLRDPYTGGHSRRVTSFTESILKEMGVSGPDAALIVSAARVHDIGKIGIPDHVLLKDGKLSDEEWAIMKLHPEQGADLLMQYPDFARGVEIVRHHHERWDGAGYPHRLGGPQIPFGARVIAVADSFDAMTSDRPYREGMSAQKAASILREGRGTQWDPKIVDAFLRTIAEELAEPVKPLLQIVSPGGELASA